MKYWKRSHKETKSDLNIITVWAASKFTGLKKWLWQIKMLSNGFSWVSVLHNVAQMMEVTLACWLKACMLM